MVEFLIVERWSSNGRTGHARQRQGLRQQPKSDFTNLEVGGKEGLWLLADHLVFAAEPIAASGGWPAPSKIQGVAGCCEMSPFSDGRRKEAALVRTGSLDEIEILVDRSASGDRMALGAGDRLLRIHDWSIFANLGWKGRPRHEVV